MIRISSEQLQSLGGGHGNGFMSRIEENVGNWYPDYAESNGFSSYVERCVAVGIRLGINSELGLTNYSIICFEYGVGFATLKGTSLASAVGCYECERVDPGWIDRVFNFLMLGIACCDGRFRFRTEKEYKNMVFSPHEIE